MPGIGIGNRLGLFFGGAAFPPILNDGNTVAWFDFLQNVQKDGSDFVSVWGDKSGNSNDELQALGTNQPLWTVDGMLFDGIDNFMKAVAFTLAQPTMIYIVLKQVAWNIGNYIFDGNTSASGLLQQSGTTPDIRVYAGGFSGADSNLAVGILGITRVLFNGASGKLIINENTPITGNFGANNMGGFTIGGRGDGTSWSNILIPEVIIRKIDDTAPNEQIIYDYLANKYSI